MNKVKKFVALMIACALCATMTGCGNKEPEEHLEMAPAVAPAPNLPANDSSKNDSLDSVEKIAVTDDTEDFYTGSGRIPSDFTPDFPTEETDLSAADGIIVLESHFYTGDDGKSNVCIYSVQSANPDTGETNSIATFSARQPWVVQSEDFYYLLPMIGMNNPIGNDRRYFSSDFSKMAVTKIFNNKNETHAGWIDSTGNFFDVTEALDEQSSDFGDPVTYGAVGFTEDDLFVYNDGLYRYSSWADLNFYFTDSKSPVVSQEGNPLANFCQVADGMHVYEISDYIDSDWCIVNYYDKKRHTSMKYNMLSKELIPYIPGKSRINWSGVCSPDKLKIAFFSMPEESNDNPGIFITSFEGGDPERLNCDVALSNDVNTAPCALLEWR